MDDVLERIERHAQWAKGGRLLYTAVVVADLIALAAVAKAMKP